MNEFRISLFRPTARSRIQLVGICAHCDGYLDACGREKGDLSRWHVVGCFPIQARRRDRCVGQPVKGDVVEDVVPRKAFLLAGEGARDEFVAACVVVEQPGGEADWRIVHCIQRLRPMAHFLGVPQPVVIEELELIVRTILVGREVRRPLAGQQSLRNARRDGARHIGVNTEQTWGSYERHLLRDRIAPIAALGDISRVSESIHQLNPGVCDTHWIPAEVGGLP